MQQKVKFDETRALRVFKSLAKAYQAKQGFFADLALPQDQWPPPGSNLTKKEMVNWLYFAALAMRGGIISEEPFKVWWHLFKESPEFFDPATIIKKLSPKIIETRLRKLLIKRKFISESNRKVNGYEIEDINDLRLKDIPGGMLNLLRKIEEKTIGYKIDEIAGSWHNNASFLMEKVDGDLLRVFQGVESFERAFARVDYKNNGLGVTGMRRKIFSLLTIWLQEKKLIHSFPTPIPIDFHAMRVLWATEIITWTPWTKNFEPTNERHPRQLTGKPVIRVGEPFVNEITKWTEKFLFENKISHLHLNPALWFLSRELCVKQFQNSSHNNGQGYVDSNELREKPWLWPKNYKNPCLYCVLENFCSWAIPAAPYYRWGLLVKVGRRISYPGAILPFGDDFYKNISPR